MRYLINCGPGIGDIIQYLSLAKAIKNNDCDAKIDLIMSSNKNRFSIDCELLELQSFIDEAYYYSKDEIIHDVFLLLKLMFKRYDIGILRIDNSVGKNNLWIYKIMRFIQCKIIISNIKKYANIYVKIDKRTHFLQKNEAFLEAMTTKNVILNNQKLLTLKDEKEKTTKYVIGIVVGTGAVGWYKSGREYIYDVKSWGYNNWINLARLLSENNFCVILMGGPKELEDIRIMDLKCEYDNVLNMIGKTNIKESLQLLNKCDLVIGSEGGMMHCANALGKKVLTIFGGSDYKQWNPGGLDGDIICLKPECYPCFGTERAFLCKDHKCLNNIVPEMVMKKIKRMFNLYED